MSTLSVTAAVLPEGCSCFTKATFQDLTPTIYENQGETAYGANRIYANAARARMVGVAPTIMEDFLLGRIRDVKEKISEVNVGGDRFINLPYTVRQRESAISNEYFRITAGASNGNTATTGEWVLTVATVDDSLFDAQSGAPIFNQFLPGQFIYVQTRDEGTAAPNAATRLIPFKIVSSADDSGDATVTVIPSYTPAGYVALTAGEKTDLAPTEGVISIGVNNVDDYEQYCDVEAVETAPQHIIDYHQTSRNAFCYTKEFLEMDKKIQAGEVNDYYKTFRYLPVTQRNRMIQQKFKNKWFHSIFYNDVLNELQAPGAYVPGSTPESLSVVDPTDTNCVLGYKANALGIRTLLANQSQIIDFTGGALDLRVVFDACYAVKRNREIDGASVDRISALTSRVVFDGVVSALIGYIKARYGYDNMNLYQEQGEVANKITGVQMRYMKFDLPEFDFEFVIASDNFFSDQEKVMTTGLGDSTHSGKIWIIDWDDLEIGIVGTSQKKIDENDEFSAKVVDELKCTIAQNTIHRTLESNTWTVRFGNEKRSLLVEGFDPTATVTLTS